MVSLIQYQTKFKLSSNPGIFAESSDLGSRNLELRESQPIKSSIRRTTQDAFAATIHMSPLMKTSKRTNTQNTNSPITGAVISHKTLHLPRLYNHKAPNAGTRAHKNALTISLIAYLIYHRRGSRSHFIRPMFSRRKVSPWDDCEEICAASFHQLPHIRSICRQLASSWGLHT